MDEGDNDSDIIVDVVLMEVDEDGGISSVVVSVVVIMDVVVVMSWEDVVVSVMEDDEGMVVVVGRVVDTLLELSSPNKQYTCILNHRYSTYPFYASIYVYVHVVVYIVHVYMYSIHCIVLQENLSGLKRKF